MEVAFSLLAIFLRPLSISNLNKINRLGILADLWFVKLYSRHSIIGRHHEKRN